VLHRLADRGLVRVDDHGKHDLAGCMVELIEPQPDEVPSGGNVVSRPNAVLGVIRFPTPAARSS
jgi:hypothetical protein